MVKKTFFVNWYITNGRDFPWRRSDTTPFAFLITEVLLRQTQAEAVAKIWPAFVAKYNDARSLLDATEEDLFSEISILGLGKQRVMALKSAAAWILEKHDGQVPDNFDELIRIPHVGMYSANAILCFAFGKRAPIVDTNIVRFFSRYYGLEFKPDIRRNKRVWELAQELLPRDRARARYHNYGLLDFSAEICGARNPRHNICALSHDCKWYLGQTNGSTNRG